MTLEQLRDHNTCHIAVEARFLDTEIGSVVYRYELICVDCNKTLEYHNEDLDTIQEELSETERPVYLHQLYVSHN